MRQTLSWSAMLGLRRLGSHLAPEAWGLSLEMQPEGSSAACEVQQGFCEWQCDQGMDTVSINGGAQGCCLLHVH